MTHAFSTTVSITKKHGLAQLIIPPVYEVYRGYIVYAFSVRILVCLTVNFFSVKVFSGTT